MGIGSSTSLQKDEVTHICKETDFTPGQVKRLYTRFTSLDKENYGYLKRDDFIRIPELHVNPLRDRIIEVLLEDHGHDDRLNFRQFVTLLSVFKRGDNGVNNSKENKLRFLFSVYDRDKDDKINKSELLAILNMLVGANLPEEQMNAIAERTIAELVIAEGGDIPTGPPTITFRQFCDSLQKIDIEDKMSMKFLT